MAITILTGAGASKPFGFPTTNEFFASEAGKRLAGNLLFTEMKQHLKVNTLDVEVVLQLLDPIADFFSTDQGKFLFDGVMKNWESRKNNWVGSIQNSIKEIQNLCFQSYGDEDLDDDLVQELYLPLLEVCGWKSRILPIFTTNYDPVTDVIGEIAHRMEVNFCDGFTSLGTWEPKTYRKFNQGILAYRLHGSMCWTKRGKSIRNTRDYHLRMGGRVEHLIIYPGFKGNPDKDEEEVFINTHQALRRRLRTTKMLVVIGFSFRDPHLNEIFHHAMTKNPDLHLLIALPKIPDDPEVGIPLLKHDFKNRVIHLPHKFGDKELINNIKGFKTKLRL